MNIVPGPSKPLRLMVTGPSSCLSSSGSWVLQPSQGTPCCWVAPIMCTGVPAGAMFSMPAGRLIFAASLSTNSRAPGETWRAGLVRSSFTLLVRLPPLRIGPTSKWPWVTSSRPLCSAVLTTARVGILVGAWAAWLLCLLSFWASLLSLASSAGTSVGMHCWFMLPGRPEDSTPLPVMPPPLLGALMFWALEPFTLDPFALVALPSLFSPLAEPFLVLLVPLIAVTPDPP